MLYLKIVLYSILINVMDYFTSKKINSLYKFALNVAEFQSLGLLPC